MHALSCNPRPIFPSFNPKFLVQWISAALLMHVIVSGWHAHMTEESFVVYWFTFPFCTTPMQAIHSDEAFYSPHTA
jgi:hypothetical protein